MSLTDAPQHGEGLAVDGEAAHVKAGPDISGLVEEVPGPTKPLDQPAAEKTSAIS